MATSVNAGEKEVKRADFGSKLEQWKAMHESAGALRRSNVATSPRRDVPTSRRWVNQYQSQQAVTSRRQRRICPPSFKSTKGSEFGVSGDVRTRARKSRAAAHRSRRRARDLYCFPFLDNRMMFYILNIDILLFSMF